MKQRNKIITLLFIASIINYLDRAAFSVAMPYIKDYLQLSPAEIGIMLSSFFFGYALFNFVGGYLSDIYGPRKVMAIAMLTWSLFCGLTGVAFSYIILFIIRVIFGMSEGPVSTNINKVITHWIPIHQRARAIGIANAGNPLGGAIAGPIVGFLIIMWNWRVAFIILMSLGFVWTFFWLKNFTDNPKDHPKTQPVEIEEFETALHNAPVNHDTQTRLPFRFYLTQPLVLATGMAFFAINYILYFFLTWFPSYLSMAKGLNIAEMSIASSIPWLLGSVGMVMGGAVSDYIYKKSGRLLFSRKLLIVVGLIASSICICIAGIVDSVTFAVIMMSFGIFFMYLAASSPWSIISDSISADKVGGVGGFVHLLANTSGMIAPILTGFIVQYSGGSFISAFILAGIVGIFGALSVALFVKPINSNKKIQPLTDTLTNLRKQ